MKRGFGISTALLWPVIALATISTIASLVRIRPHDFWWHMKIGELIASTGRIPTTDTFSFTQAGAPFVYQSWLSELIFYWLYQSGGIPLIILTRNGLHFLAYTLLVWQAYKRSRSWPLAAIAALAAAAVAFNNWIVRPQIFSWVPFMFFWTILAGYTGGWLRARWLLLLPLVQVAWANLHGGFILGPVLVGIVAGGEMLQAAAKACKEQSPASRTLRSAARALLLGAKQVTRLWLVLAALLAATLLNPRGLGLYSYVWTLLTDPPSQQLVIEWQPPEVTDPIGFLFFASLMIIWLLCLREPAKARLSDILIFLAFTWLALDGVRYTIWYGMVAAPFAAQLLASERSRLRNNPIRPALARLNLLLALLFFLPVLLVQPPLRRVVPLQAIFGDSPAVEQPYLTEDTPVAAVAYLQKHPVGSRLFHAMAYGSYLIWTFGGEPPVFADPRVELYPFDFWQQYRRISAGCDYAALFASYQIDALLLDRASQQLLIERVSIDRAWEQVYEDEQSIIFRRTKDTSSTSAMVVAANDQCGQETLP